jgi:hypothetical protein
MNAVVNWVDLFDVLRAIVIVGAVVLYLAMTAGRLDRLHIRVDAARASLELQLALRAEVVAEVVTDGNVDPVSQQLLTAGLQSRRGHTDQGIHVAPEAEISALLREVVEAHDGVVAGEELQSELRSACNRVEFANRFYNDAVEAAQGMRNRPIVKYLGLAGHTAYPMPLQFDVLAPEFPDS